MAFDGAPRLTRAERDAARGRLAKMRAEDLARALAQLTRQALEDGRAPSKFAYEAVFRATIRAALCLQGWRWHSADDAAALVVRVALELLRAERPSWNEGQPEHVVHGGALIQRLRCANCHKPLEDHQLKFCSKLCADSYGWRVRNYMAMDEARAGQLAARIDL